MSALAAAVEGGNVRAALDLLSKGADVNEKGVFGRTLLHVACAKGLHALLKPMVDAGANLKAKTQYGGTPLHTAAWAGDSKCVTELLNLGADPNMKDDRGDTPAGLAIRYGHSDTARLISACKYEYTDEDHINNNVSELRAKKQRGVFDSKVQDLEKELKDLKESRGILTVAEAEEMVRKEREKGENRARLLQQKIAALERQVAMDSGHIQLSRTRSSSSTTMTHSGDVVEVEPDDIVNAVSAATEELKTKVKTMESSHKKDLEDKEQEYSDQILALKRKNKEMETTLVESEAMESSWREREIRWRKTDEEWQTKEEDWRRTTRTLKDRIAENEDEVVELERRIKRAKRDASSELEDKLAESLAANSQLKSQLAAMSTKLEATEASVQSETRARQQASEDLETERMRLEKKLREARARAAENEEDLHDQLQRAKQSGTPNATEMVAKSTVDAAILDLRDSRAANESLTLELADLRKEHEKLKVSNSEVSSKQSEEAQSKFEAASSELSDLRNRETMALTAAKRMAEEIHNLRNQIEQLEAKIKVLTTDRSAQDLANLDLRSEVAELKDSKNALAEKIRRVSAEREVAQSDLAHSIKVITALMPKEGGSPSKKTPTKIGRSSTMANIVSTHPTHPKRALSSTPPPASPPIQRRTPSMGGLSLQRRSTMGQLLSPESPNRSRSSSVDKSASASASPTSRSRANSGQLSPPSLRKSVGANNMRRGSFSYGATGLGSSLPALDDLKIEEENNE